LIGSSISIFFISGELHVNLWFIIFLSMCLAPLAKRRPALRQAPAGERTLNPGALTQV
jgi:hypothetical protein